MCRLTSMRPESSRHCRYGPIPPAGRARRLSLTATSSCSFPRDWTASRSTGPISRQAPSQFLLSRPPPRPFKLKIETRLDPAANTKLMGLYRTGSAYCTQCEAEGFRRITYFLDRPDVLSTYRVRLEADRDEAPVLLSNGNLEATGEADIPGRHYAIWQDPHKKPCYLFALVAGNLGHIAQFVCHCVRPQCRARDLRGTWPRGPRPLRDGRAQAIDGLGRTGVRARI